MARVSAADTIGLSGSVALFGHAIDSPFKALPSLLSPTAHRGGMGVDAGQIGECAIGLSQPIFTWRVHQRIAQPPLGYLQFWRVPTTPALNGKRAVPDHRTGGSGWAVTLGRLRPGISG